MIDIKLNTLKQVSPGLITHEFRFNLNKSSYLQSQIFSINLSRAIWKGKLHGTTYFRKANYNYINSETQRDQNLYGLNLSFRINRKLRLSLLSEISKTEDRQNIRINTKLIKRFDSK